MQIKLFFNYSLRLFPLHLCLVLLLPISCLQYQNKNIKINREELFSLTFGLAQDQIDLFRQNTSNGFQKTRLAMQEGIFYIANGNVGKVMKLSSYGELLTLLYNPEKDPVKQQGTTLGAASQILDRLPGRQLFSFPFRSVGEIAIDSAQRLYIEDRQKVRIQDKETGTILDHIIQRFDKDGNYLGFLGQEGYGGTPFAYILGVYINAIDDCIVISMQESFWQVQRFNSQGNLENSIKIKRTALPISDKNPKLIANLDKIIPDSNSRYILLKVDYYAQTEEDSINNSGQQIDLYNSWMYRMDLNDAAIVEKWKVKSYLFTGKDAEGKTYKYVKVPGLLGATGNFIFYMMADSNVSGIFVYDRIRNEYKVFDIGIKPEELYFSTYYISKDAVLCAILATKYTAKIVWWRFDTLRL